MTGRLNSVMAELGALGAVFRPGPPVTLPVAPKQDAGTTTLPLLPDLAPPPVPTPSLSPDEAVIPVDEDVEAKIRALSEMTTGAISPSYSELRSAFERDEDDAEEEDAEDAEDEEDEDEEEDEEDLPEVAEAIPEPVSPPREPRIRAAPSSSSHTARRLKEAFARLDLLEACVADLRDSLLAVASSINEES
jgi:hypothetical protein